MKKRIILVLSLGVAAIAICIFLLMESKMSAQNDLTEDASPVVDGHLILLVALIGNFKKDMGYYPPTDNASFMRAMLGENAKGKIFVSYSKEGLSPKGEFLDPWKKAYQIKIDQSKNTGEIRSAGPDGLFGDQDDKVELFP